MATVARDYGYEDRYVLFVDILGFTNMVESGRWSPASLVAALRKAQCTSEPDGDRIRTCQFSDSIVVSVPNDEFGFFSITKVAFFLAIELIQHRVLLRGGISLGQIYHSDNFCFGPAFLRAYQLEQQARYPRVVLDKDLFERAHWPDSMDKSEIRGYGRRSVPQDSDDYRFVDYFHHKHSDEFDEDVEGLRMHYQMLDRLIADHKDVDIERIREKYDWVSGKLELARARMRNDWGSHSI